MYAIISDGGKQIKVTKDEEIVIDYRDVPAGEKVTFDRVLAVSDGSGDLKLGAPLVQRRERRRRGDRPRKGRQGDDPEVPQAQDVPRPHGLSAASTRGCASARSRAERLSPT